MDGLPACRHPIRVTEAAHQGQTLFPVGALADEKPDLFFATHRQIDMQLQNGAGINPRFDATRQPDAMERGGPRHRAQPSQKLAAVGGQAVEFLAGGDKGHPFAKLAVVSIVGQQRLYALFVFGNNRLLALLAVHP